VERLPQPAAAALCWDAGRFTGRRVGTERRMKDALPLHTSADDSDDVQPHSSEAMKGGLSATAADESPEAPNRGRSEEPKD
jgi:hypothetical protein